MSSFTGEGEERTLEIPFGGSPVQIHRALVGFLLIDLELDGFRISLNAFCSACKRSHSFSPPRYLWTWAPLREADSVLKFALIGAME
jgi:hypothetical protein